MNKLELKGELHSSEASNVVAFVTNIYIDGKALIEYPEYIIFLTELKSSLGESGNYFIITCTCGMPECAGIYRGVEVVHDSQTVRWIISQSGPRQVFVFDSSEYEHAIIFGIQRLKKEIEQLWFTPSGTRDETFRICAAMQVDEEILEPKPRPKGKRRHVTQSQ